MAETVTVEAEAQAINTTSSYARVMDNREVKQRLDSVAEPIQRNYQSLIRQLRDQNAVGVVVAVNGQIIWADIFASTSLLEKYWPKLVSSYAAEAVVTRTKSGEVESARRRNSSIIWTDATKQWTVSRDFTVTQKLPERDSGRSS